MLTRIELSHLKCFEHLQVPLRPLTALTGPNASGKSTVLQALLLLHQTMRDHEWSTRLMLNGSATRMGTVGDIISPTGRDTIEIGLSGQESSVHWSFTGARPEMSMDVSGMRVNETEERPPRVVRNLMPQGFHDDSMVECLRRISLLSAERLGPRETYPLMDPKRAASTDPAGEYAASTLHTRGDGPALPGLTISGAAPTLRRQVEAHMMRLFPEFELSVNKISMASAVTLGIRTSSEMNHVSPKHTGFGVTQALPIILTVLAANEGDTILVENPEVHLHPSGQTTMGQFLAEAAGAGIQVLVETHSDHVVNGIRKAVIGEKARPEDVAFIYFRPLSQVTGAGMPQSTVLGIDKRGNLDDWPDGFFDQFDKDMRELLGWD